MIGRPRAHVRFGATLFFLNLRAALEYRVSFVAGMALMALNDGMWIVFWTMFFDRFPVVRGWELRDIATMWAMAATGFGLATGVFGNSRPEAARLIVEGRLDYHLSLPKSPALHFLLGSISVTALGDIAFGVLSYVVIVRPGPAAFALFLALSLLACTLFVSFGLLVNSLAFFLGNSEALGQQLMNALITFSTYPLDLFGFGVRLLLFVAIPAGFLTYLPVRLLRDFDPWLFGGLAAFVAGLAALSLAVFHVGLRRYESGSLVTLRG